MKKTSYLLFFKVLVLILFLSIGQISLASPDHSLEAKVELVGEIQVDHHLNYDGQSSSHDMVMEEGNYQIPSVNELRPNFNSSYSSSTSCLVEVSGKVHLFLNGGVHITPSLDGLTMIYPFHTFL
ncbi:hypothetical protein DHD32_08540 [Arenibacter sp. TNZ]|jgi:hypothetical protein|uniref:hypothetical protein n=1 Tax=Arenibacter TaxID=178469 RepID=UPI000CD404BC|nr:MULTISPECIES: hypothetical protein [Arenibacter]MCM4171525.1 hypothetical protein [Arenibacter sp. TNZ]